MVAITKNEDDVIGHVIGDWGKWQLRAVLLIYICKIPSAWFMACIIFSAPSPMQGEFYCQPENSTTLIMIRHPELVEINDKQFNVDYCNVYEDSIEHTKIYHPVMDASTSSDNANMALEWKQSINHKQNQKIIIPCKTFTHQPHVHTKVTTFDVFCSRNFVAGVTQFFHLFGVLLGGIIATNLLNYISPKRLMLYGMIGQILFGNIIAFVGNYKLHLLLRTICAICLAQLYTSGQMIFSDITVGKMRTTVLCYFESFWSIGVIMLPSIAYKFQTFQNIYLAITIPTCLYVLLWHWIPDSPRWLLAKGLIKETKQILYQSIEFNGRRHLIPNDLDDRLHHQLILNSNQIESGRDVRGGGAPQIGGWLSLWKGKKNIIYLLAAHIAWAVCVTNFNGMLLNTRNFGAEYLYGNVILMGATEILGVTIALFIIFNSNRKWMWTGLFNIFTGFLVLTTWFIPSTLSGENITVILIFALLPKAAISCSQAILVTCTSELVTPEKRKICIFSCVVFARICLLCAPFIVSLSLVHTLLPLTIFGLSATVGGLATCIITTPRTIAKVKKTINNYSDKQKITLLIDSRTKS